MSDKESSVLKENRWRLKIKKHLRLEGVIEGDRGMGTSSLWPCTWWHQFGLGCLRRHLPGKRETHKMNSDSFLSFFGLVAYGILVPQPEIESVPREVKALECQGIPSHILFYPNSLSEKLRTSLVVQWIRVCLLMLGTQV